MTTCGLSFAPDFLLSLDVSDITVMDLKYGKICQQYVCLLTTSKHYVTNSVKYIHSSAVEHCSYYYTKNFDICISTMNLIIWYQLSSQMLFDVFIVPQILASETMMLCGWRDWMCFELHSVFLLIVNVKYIWPLKPSPVNIIKVFVGGNGPF